MGLIATPHTVSVFTPDVSRDAEHNASSADYEASDARSVDGMFQTRQGDVIADQTGKARRYNAMFYTYDENINVDDVIRVDLPGMQDDFIVIAREPKYAIDGSLTHIQILLEKELRGVKS